MSYYPILYSKRHPESASITNCTINFYVSGSERQQLLLYYLLIQPKTSSSIHPFIHRFSEPTYPVQGHGGWSFSQ